MMGLVVHAITLYFGGRLVGYATIFTGVGTVSRYGIITIGVVGTMYDAMTFVLRRYRVINGLHRLIGYRVQKVLFTRGMLVLV